MSTLAQKFFKNILCHTLENIAGKLNLNTFESLKSIKGF